MKMEKNGTLHMTVGGVLLLIGIAVLATGGSPIAFLLFGALGIGVLVYGINLMNNYRSSRTTENIRADE